MRPTHIVSRRDWERLIGDLDQDAQVDLTRRLNSFVSAKNVQYTTDRTGAIDSMSSPIPTDEPTDEERALGELTVELQGMSLRDWLAGQAIAGLCVGVAGILGGKFSAYNKGPCNATLAERAYALADTLLSERKNKQ